MKCKETTVLFFMVILLGGFFFAGIADAKTKLKIPYTPFGGQIEKYKATSDAACVKESCGEVNEAIRKTVRGAIEAPATAICAIRIENDIITYDYYIIFLKLNSSSLSTFH